MKFKNYIIVLSLFLFCFSDLSGKIHIWAIEGNDDYSWENGVVQELRNSKYSNLFGEYTYYHNYQNVNKGDYIIMINIGFAKKINIKFGHFILVKTEFINGEWQLLYRASHSFLYAADSDTKLKFFIETKNIIIDFIDEGFTSY